MPLASCMQMKQVSGWVWVDVVQASTGGRSYMRSKDGVFFSVSLMQVTDGQ